MARPTSRRSLRFENLEDRQLLSSGGPSSQQQYMLQLINMARTAPKVAAEWVSSNVTPEVRNTLNHYNVDVNAVKQTIASSNPLPPVAWNDDLADAAQSHSEDMADNQFQSHEGSNGSSPDDRIKAAGYNNAKSSGENAFAYANSVDNAMQAFLYDWGVADAGHRRNLLQPGVAAEKSFSDVGIGIVNTGMRASKAQVGPVVVTQNFASKADGPAKLVGAVYSDDDGSKMYTPGEGRGDVRIDATNLETGRSQSTRTWESGGYELALTPGRYRVAASRNDVLIKETTINMGTVNVAQDFDLSESWDGRSVAADAPAPAKPAPAPTTVSAPTKSPTPVKISAPTKSSTPVKVKPADNADADWKTVSAAVSNSASKTPRPNTFSRPPLADWTTWKANSR